MTAIRQPLASLLILCALVSLAGAQAPVDGPFVSFGQTQHGVDTFRIGLRRAFPGAVARTDVGYVSGHVESAFLYWRLGDETAYGAAVGPFVAYYFGSDSSTVRPYIGGGVAAAYVSESRMGSRDLATHFQFEDRIGLGMESGRFDAYLCVVHYSNGSIKPPNDGLEAVMLVLAWSLQ